MHWAISLRNKNDPAQTLSCPRRLFSLFLFRHEIENLLQVFPGPVTSSRVIEIFLKSHSLFHFSGLSLSLSNSSSIQGVCLKYFLSHLPLLLTSWQCHPKNQYIVEPRHFSRPYPCPSDMKNYNPRKSGAACASELARGGQKGEGGFQWNPRDVQRLYSWQ